jgi:putative phosphoribosyl transferase
VLNESVIMSVDISSADIEMVSEQERAELHRRERLYRDDRPPPDVRGRFVILVDDGLATGATMRAAVAGLRRQDPARIIVAVPTAARETCTQLRAEVDELVCATTPAPFYGVGLWYEDFGQTSDEEVRALLAKTTPSAAE